MTISCEVLMRTKNSSPVIRAVLNSLFSQKNILFKLHVCDSGSTDDTLKILAEYPHKLTKIEPREYYPGDVLNRLVSESQEEVLVLLNSDAILLNPDSIFFLILNLNRSSQNAAVFGRQIAHSHHPAWVLRDYESSFPAVNPPAPWMHMSAPIAVIRKSIWKIRPFYSLAWGSEDVEWAFWAKQSFLNVNYEPAAIALHSHDYTSAEIYRRKFIEGEADVFIFDKCYSLGFFILESIKETIGDFLWALRRGVFSGLYKSMYIHFWEKYGYYRGVKQGRKRKKNKDLSRSIAQDQILKNYK